MERPRERKEQMRVREKEGEMRKGGGVEERRRDEKEGGWEEST